MTHEVWAGLDIGGSKVEGVLTDAAGTVLGQVRLRSTAGADGITSTARRALTRLRTSPAADGRQLAAVGVGVPGVVDVRAGHVSHAVNLGLGAGGLALRDALRVDIDCPVVIENDVNAAALGAWHLRRPAAPDLAYLSIGTGLAAGVVLGGRLRRGTRGASGEIGHVPVDPAGPVCACGQRGCLEMLASGAAIARRWPASDGLSPARALFDAADRGDPAAVAARDDVAHHLAAAVRLLVLTLDVEVVVLGGGVAELGARLLRAVTGALAAEQAGSPLLRALELSARVALVTADSPVGALGASLAGQQGAAAAAAPPPAGGLLGGPLGGPSPVDVRVGG